MAWIFAAVGECMIELSGAGDHLYRQGFAGDSFNTAWTVRGLAPAGEGVVRYVTAVGDDRLSDEFAGFVLAAGIDATHVRRIAGGRMGLYMIHLDGHERSFSYWRETAAARRLADDPAALEAAFADVDCAYFSGITLAILAPDARARLLAALAGARARGAMVAFDPNVRPRLWASEAEMRAATAAGYAAASVALPTWPDEEAMFADGSMDALADRALAAGCAEVVVKAGPEPCLVADAGGRVRVPAVAVERPVDTTGAGDSFNAGYLAARLAGLDPASAARRGHAVAARVIGVRGALAPPEMLAGL